MKAKHIFKTCAAAAVAVATLASCSDFLTIYPTDKTVGEDFWKKKADVQEMATGAYKQFANGPIQERSIVWGGFRSDELVKREGQSNANLDNINVVNILPDNAYTSWGDFYAVINRCNLVLKHSPGVMEVDPEFTQGDYDVIKAQMLALRSLCYFYLVRTFRDVPYTTQGYDNDNMDFTLPQTAPDSVLQYCIRDLEEAGKTIMKSGAYGQGDWRNKGYFTADAVNALLADIHLWRGSMNHDAESYRKCVEYADKVIDAKDKYYRSVRRTQATSTEEDDKYHLTSAKMRAWYNIFTTGNDHESILEMQYDGTNNSNSTLANWYYEGSAGGQPIVMASKLFTGQSEQANTLEGAALYATLKDYRYWNDCYDVGNREATQLSIRKMTSNSTTLIDPSKSGVTGEKRNTTRPYDNFKQNWIVYRLTDVMLMKAEALVQLAEGEGDTQLEDAFWLVQKVNKRSLADNAAENDTLKPSNFNTKEAMEALVLAERGRELAFEGKRWYDLVRFCYRHMDGVNYSALMADQAEWPALYEPMIKMIVRKYESGGDAMSFKMKSEPFLYMPIEESETKVNPLLKQNPVFKEKSTTTKTT